jgi:hypothetical protein
MNYQLTQYNTIIRLDDNANIPMDPGNTDYQDYLAWVALGNTPEPVPAPPAPTHQEITLTIQTGVQQWLDQTAQSKGYDSAMSCITYLSSSNATFAAEANSMLHWRDAVWNQCYALLAQWTANTPSPLPTVESTIALLPTANSFGWA